MDNGRRTEEEEVEIICDALWGFIFTAIRFVYYFFIFKAVAGVAALLYIFHDDLSPVYQALLGYLKIVWAALLEPW